MSQPQRAFRLGTVFTVALFAGLAVPADPAQARSTTSVTLPGHGTGTTLTLLSASAHGVAVRQAGIPGVDGSLAAGANRIFSGAEGTQLSRRPVIEPTVVDNGGSVLSVVGATLTWYQRVLPFGGPDLYTVHRMNVRTGTDVVDGLMPPPMGFTGDAWLSNRISNYNVYPFPPPVLRRYPISTPPADPSGLLAGIDVIGSSSNNAAFASDATSALISTFELSDPADGDSPRLYNLDLIDLATRTVEHVISSGTDVITSVALSDDTIAWTAQAPGGPLRINQRARAASGPGHLADPVSSYLEIDSLAAGAKLAAGHGRVGYLVPGADGASPVLRIVTDGAPSAPTIQSVELPAGSSGLAAVGDRFLTASGATPATAGVYSIDAFSGTPVRTASVPARSFPIQSLSMSASRIYYTDDSQPDQPDPPDHSGQSSQPGRPVWWRSLSGTGRTKLSAESMLALRSAGASNPVPAPSISFSAGRGAIGTPLDNSVELLDRGEVIGAVPETGMPNVSGPYTLLNGKVYRPYGERLYVEPDQVDDLDRADDIFGGTVIYSRLRPGTGGDGPSAEVWTEDVENSQPMKRAVQSGCSAAPPVSIWGDTMAWADCAAPANTDPMITVATLGSSARRMVPTDVPEGGSVSRLILGEGMLAWYDGEATHLLDLTRADSRPVTLPGRADSIVIDDHRIARRLVGPQGPDAVDIRPLPFGGDYPPRLLGRLGPLGFTPDGDGHADTWKPEFDVTKPLRKAQLAITQLSGGKALRTLTASAPDGSIRSFVWDGRTTKGSPLPIGTYRWTLTGRADDGEGTLVAADGTQPISGTVEIDAIDPVGR